MYIESKELNNVYQETELWWVFLLLKIAVQIGLYVNINVNIKGPTFVSFHLSRVRECGKCFCQ